MKAAAKSLQRRHIEVLVAVADAKSVHRAAALLSMSQPAVSRLLGEAEAILATPIFTRSSHGSTPTPAGLAVLAHARFVLRGMDRLQDLATLAPVVIRLGCIPRAMHTLMPHLVNQIYPARSACAATTAKDPEYRFQVSEATSIELLDSISSGSLDFAILRPSGSDPVSNTLRCERLYDERLVVICANENSEVLSTAAPLKTLGGCEWILPGSRTTSRVIFEQFWEASGLAPIRPVIEARSFEASLALVAGTRLLSIAPESIARRHVEFGALRILDVNPRLPSSQVMLAFNATVNEDEVLNGFRNLVHIAAMEVVRHAV